MGGDVLPPFPRFRSNPEEEEEEVGPPFHFWLPFFIAMDFLNPEVLSPSYSGEYGILVPGDMVELAKCSSWVHRSVVFEGGFYKWFLWEISSTHSTPHTS